jgi:phosphoribosylamine--glycine ligase
MRILIIGSGGREHALAWKIAQSPLVEKLYAAPGSDGMAALAEPVMVDSNSVEALADWAEENKIDIAVVGSEVYLSLGITDAFSRRGVAMFGPSYQAARLESSKVFAKRFMTKYRIPTARFEVFDQLTDAMDYIQAVNSPLVIKADGLAAGKGVIVTDTIAEAQTAVDQIMGQRLYGDAGKVVLVEERLYGEEVSLLAISDGTHILPLIPAQDHKRVFVGDHGPNTGGMGAYAPASVLTPELLTKVEEDILRPVIKGMANEGYPYVGILYAGLMLTDSGPKVIEFNVRFGDPEAQVILPLLRNDLVELMQATLHQELHLQRLDWKKGASACVVLASEGYPGSYEVGKEIFGLAAAENIHNLLIFHAGTKSKRGKWRTAGGRVLNLVGLGSDLPAALKVAYQGANLINFQGAYYRSDIGWRELARK